MNRDKANSSQIKNGVDIKKGDTYKRSQRSDFKARKNRTKSDKNEIWHNLIA